MRGTRSPKQILMGVVASLAMLMGVFALGASPADGAVEVEAVRLSGPDRYVTAAQAALAAYPGGANNIILASGENFPDGLAAAYLSGAVGAPVLLTARDALPSSTANAIGTIDALLAGDATVHVVGGNAAVSPAVRAQLTTLGYELNEISGANRYETAASVAAAGNTAGGVGSFDGKRTAIVTTGENYPDALSAGSLAHGGRHPVLLTNAGALPGATNLVLDALNIEQVIILGGTGAVSPAVATAIEAKGIDVTRISGANRFGTAAALAELLTTPPAADGFGWDGVEFVLARGTNFPDALAASQVGGVHQAPILLTSDTLPIDTRNLLTARSHTAATLFAMGGTGAISATTLQQAVNAATIDAPTATVAALATEGTFTVKFSEPVVNADDIANYRLNNAALPGGSTIAEGPGTNEVTITLGGGTTLAIHDVITVNPAGGDIESLVGARVPLTTFTVVEEPPAP